MKGVVRQRRSRRVKEGEWVKWEGEVGSTFGLAIENSSLFTHVSSSQGNAIST